MFNDSFFPTPKAIAIQMGSPYFEGSESKRDVWATRVLDPSAGKGDLLEAVYEKYNYRSSWNRLPKDHFVAIEIEPELQAILRDKGFKLIDTDFLKFCDPYPFELILMNPPFDEGAKHLLKAWDVVAADGDIACLLNAETVNNPYTAERTLLKRLIDDHGTVEALGPVFANAERPTNVEVVLVRLHKPASKDKNWFEGFTGDHDAPKVDAEFRGSPLANADLIQTLVDQHNRARDLLLSMSKERAELRYMTDAVKGRMDELDKAPSLVEQLDTLKAMFWSHVFDKTKLGQVTTSDFQRKFEEQRKSTSSLAFSYDNIMAVLTLFMENKDSILQQCIETAFDTATKFHEKNVVHGEGWKHNKSWKVAPMIIIPHGVTYEPKWGSWSSVYGYYGSVNDFYKDVDKVLCFITGRRLDSVVTLAAAIDRRISELRRDDSTYADWFDSTFFTIRFYKKGTVHIKFKDKAVLDAFNQAAAKQKGWLGAGY